jgi:hypothetical protein
MCKNLLLIIKKYIMIKIMNHIIDKIDEDEKVFNEMIIHK